MFKGNGEIVTLEWKLSLYYLITYDYRKESSEAFSMTGKQKS